MDLTEERIAHLLREAHRPGRIASVDGNASLYEGVRLTCAAVLLPLARLGQAWHLVLTRRTQAVKHHKGQVSFPGGACHPGEDNPEATALRETEEEIGLEAGRVRLLGRLDDVLTITRYRVTPVVGIVPWPYDFRLAPAEVERVFTLPLAWLADLQNCEQKTFTPDGVRRPFPVLIYHPYDGEVLWGASARITHNFLKVLGWLGGSWPSVGD